MNYFVMPGLRVRPKFNPVYRDKDFIVRQVCAHFDIDVSTLKVRRRDRHIVIARQICFYYMYKMTYMKLNDIARYFAPAVSHHTTVMHGIDMVSGQKEMKFDNEIKTHLQNIGL